MIRPVRPYHTVISPFFQFAELFGKICIRVIFLTLLLAITFVAPAQPARYSVNNAHSHNDYEQLSPFWLAYNAGFGSIEADIFLIDSVLYVAHDSAELRRQIKLETEYLMPILTCLHKNNNRPFADKNKRLQMLIDIKSDSIGTLNALIRLLNKYPSLIRSESVSWVITGNRPDQILFVSYPDFIFFDGELGKNYSQRALTRIRLMSDNFRNYSLWSGQNDLASKDSLILGNAIHKSHQQKKPVRFWNAPDNINAWRELMILQVDYINTDHIDSLAGFLNKTGLKRTHD